MLIYLVGYCPDTLQYYLSMFVDAQKLANMETIGQDISLESAICTKVHKSRSCKGFTLMIISISGKKQPIVGFEECTWESLDIDAY